MGVRQLCSYLSPNLHSFQNDEPWTVLRLLAIQGTTAATTAILLFFFFVNAHLGHTSAHLIQF